MGMVCVGASLPGTEKKIKFSALSRFYANLGAPGAASGEASYCTDECRLREVNEILLFVQLCELEFLFLHNFFTAHWTNEFCSIECNSLLTRCRVNRRSLEIGGLPYYGNWGP